MRIPNVSTLPASNARSRALLPKRGSCIAATCHGEGPNVGDEITSLGPENAIEWRWLMRTDGIRGNFDHANLSVFCNFLSNILRGSLRLDK